jgi:hypothetical protein
MGKLIAMIMPWIIGSQFAKMMTGVGIAVVSHAFLSGYVDDMLAAIVNQVNGLGSDVLNIFLMLGFGQFLSILGSAFLTRVTVQQMAKTWGITSSSAT